MSPLYSFNMAERGRRILNLQEALESIFPDDSDNENFDCGSDFEAVPDSEEEFQTDDSDLYDSLMVPQECTYNPTDEQNTPSESSTGTFF